MRLKETVRQWGPTSLHAHCPHGIGSRCPPGRDIRRQERHPHNRTDPHTHGRRVGRRDSDQESRDQAGRRQGSGDAEKQPNDQERALLAEWIGQGVSGFDVSTWVLVFIVLVAIVYLTEITSNTATTATFLPILGAVAVGLGIDPQMLVVPVALAASMAFMMPVATPPNAIVFSYEELQLGDMVKAGFWLNIIAILVGFCAMYFLAGLVFGVSA